MQQIIQHSTIKEVLFPKDFKNGINPIIDLLPQSFSQNQNNNKSNSPVLQIKFYNQTKAQQNLTIGLVTFDQNKHTLYGTGTLIHNNLILTTAQNVYCRRLHKQYTNIKFQSRMNSKGQNHIYDVMRVYYPKQYAEMEEDFQKYNFAILQLYDDLSISHGYMGFKASRNLQNQNIQICGYTSDEHLQKFQVYNRITKSVITNNFIHYSQDTKAKLLSGNPLIIIEKNKYYIVGLASLRQDYNIYMTDEIKNIMNEWTTMTKLNLRNDALGGDINKIKNLGLGDIRQINLYNNNLGSDSCNILKTANWINRLRHLKLDNNKISSEGCKYLAQVNWTCLNTIDLGSNQIDYQGCIYLKSANMKHLIELNLGCNQIGDQGCRHLKQANWPYLMNLYLDENEIGSEGCQNLKDAKWIYLAQLNISWNQINSQACKYLAQADWCYLKNLNLGNNSIKAQGCRNLKEAKWNHLTTIELYNNSIDSEGCKYLAQATWANFLKIIDLGRNNIGPQGCRYLRQANWKHLIEINLESNNIDGRGIKYLKDTNWAITDVNLSDNLISEYQDPQDSCDILLIRQLWSPISFRY